MAADFGILDSPQNFQPLRNAGRDFDSKLCNKERWSRSRQTGHPFSSPPGNRRRVSEFSILQRRASVPDVAPFQFSWVSGRLIEVAVVQQLEPLAELTDRRRRHAVLPGYLAG